MSDADFRVEIEIAGLARATERLGAVLDELDTVLRPA